MSLVAWVVGLALAQGTAVVHPDDVGIPDPWRPSEVSPLSNEALSACRVKRPVEGLVQGVIELDADELRFAGRRIAPHAGGKFPEHLVDHEVLVPLRDRLERTARDLEALQGQGCSVAAEGFGAHRLVIAVDGRVRMALLHAVLTTARNAGFQGFDLLVDGDARIPPQPAARGSGRRIQLVVRADGLTVFADQRDRTVDGHEPDAIRAAVRELVPAGEPAPVVPVIVQGDVPWSTVLDAMRGAAWDAEGSPLLPHFALGSGAKGTSVDAPSGREGMPSSVVPAGGATVLRTGPPG